MIRHFALSAVLVAGTAHAALAQEAPPADELTVLLEWFVNPDHAPLVIAEELGLFAEAGLAVTLVPPADPSAPPRLIAAEQTEIAIHYQPNLYLDHAAGLPLIRFGTLVETPLNTVMALADGEVETLADLAGRQIGYSVSGFEEAMLGRMLASAGLSTEDVTLINVNFALTQSLVTGQVDATIGGFRNFELTQMQLVDAEGRMFFPEEHGVPPYDELIFVTHENLIEDDRLPRFLEAVERGALHLTNHPEEAWALYVAAYPELDDELNRRAWFDTLPRFAKRPAALDHRRYERFGAFMAEAGLIETAPAVEDVAVELR